jgi:signal transduction histidine kinase
MDLREVLDDLVKDSLRAGEIVARTRDMFANQPVQKRALDLNEPIRDVLDIVRPRLRDYSIALEVDLDEGLPLVDADAIQIQQVLLNLVMNGVDAMQDVADRPRVLKIRSRRHRRGAVVSVRDTGEGIEPHAAGRVFDSFYTTKAGGVGMGLAISRSIVESHHGLMWVVPNSGGGATFRFMIPGALIDSRGVAT